MKCYYAHPISDYGTLIEKLDIMVLDAMGYEVVNPNTPELDAAYKGRGMEVFIELVDQCDVVAFRGFIDGKIPAGVGMEVIRALETHKPFFEMPTPIGPRILTVEQTRARLKELGRK